MKPVRCHSRLQFCFNHVSLWEFKAFNHARLPRFGLKFMGVQRYYFGHWRDHLLIQQGLYWSHEKKKKKYYYYFWNELQWLQGSDLPEPMDDKVNEK